MLAVTMEGRAIELSCDGALVWEYVNRVDDGYRGIVTQASLLPAHMDAGFFSEKTRACPAG